jgi:hypothetical protein
VTSRASNRACIRSEVMQPRYQERLTPTGVRQPNRSRPTRIEASAGVDRPLEIVALLRPYCAQHDFIVEVVE